MLEPIANYDAWKLQEPPEESPEEPYDHCDLCGGAILRGDTVYVIHGKPCCKSCIEDCIEVAG